MIYKARVAVFALTSLCGVVLVGIGASIEGLHWIVGGPPAFASIAIAAGALTLLTLPAMVIIDYFISSAFVTSWIIVELAVSTLLWILFASAAGTSTTGFCAAYWGIDMCSKAHATAAFGYFAAFILIVYSLGLLVRAYLASRRGASVWGTSVKDADFGGSSAPMTQRV